MSKENYFDDQAEAQQPTEEGSFFKWDVQDPIEVLPGLRFHPILGKNLMANVVHIEPNSSAPVHRHEEEQISIVLEGELEFEVGEQKKIVRRGEAVLIPPYVPHSARTFESSCLELDIFTPPRQALLGLMGDTSSEKETEE